MVVSFVPPRRLRRRPPEGASSPWGRPGGDSGWCGRSSKQRGLSGTVVLAEQPLACSDVQATEHVHRREGLVAQRDAHALAGLEGQLAFTIEGERAGRL